MANYITSSDIHSTVFQDFNMTNYINHTNDQVDYLASSLGVTSADIYTPILHILKEYAVAYCQREMAKDKIGTNNLDVQVANDKYFVLYQINSDEVERLRKYINAEIIKNTAIDPSEFSPSVTIYRG
jgi:hypothetical protein